MPCVLVANGSIAFRALYIIIIILHRSLFTTSSCPSTPFRLAVASYYKTSPSPS